MNQYLVIENKNDYRAIMWHDLNKTDNATLYDSVLLGIISYYVFCIGFILAVASMNYYRFRGVFSDQFY